MHYQPQIDCITGRIIGAEGLMRWNHPVRGLLTAGEFLPFAEENGLMLPISDWMIGALCRDMLLWNAAGGQAVRLSLNLDRKSTRLNSSHSDRSRMPSSA